MINIRKYLFIKKYDLNNPEICFKKNKMTKMSKSRYKVSNPKISGHKKPGLRPASCIYNDELKIYASEIVISYVVSFALFWLDINTEILEDLL